MEGSQRIKGEETNELFITITTAFVTILSHILKNGHYFSRSLEVLNALIQ